MRRTDVLPDGFYLLKNDRHPSVSLVYLYDHEDFNGVRRIAFGPWDGAALMPVTDLCDDSYLLPVCISFARVPTNITDLDGMWPGGDEKAKTPNS